MSAAAQVDYDRIAERYDAHRGWECAVPLRLLELSAGTVDSRRPAGPLLEIGCGTGNATRWFLEHWPGPVLALDFSRGMLQKARPKLGLARLLRATAARLPFRAGFFAGIVGSYVLHHLDAGARASAMAEFQRVLARARGGQARAGGVAFLTSSHAQIRQSYLVRWFPSIAEVDCARFPDLDVLRAELGAAGFTDIGMEETVVERPPGGAETLEKARGRFISSLELVPPDEFKDGLRRMERQLAETGSVGDVTWRGTIVHACAE